MAVIVSVLVITSVVVVLIISVVVTVTVVFSACQVLVVFVGVHLQLLALKLVIFAGLISGNI